MQTSRVNRRNNRHGVCKQRCVVVHDNVKLAALPHIVVNMHGSVTLHSVYTAMNSKQTMCLFVLPVYHYYDANL